MSVESVAATKRFKQALDQAETRFLTGVDTVVESFLNELNPRRQLTDPKAVLRITTRDGHSRRMLLDETRFPHMKEVKTPWGIYCYGPGIAGFSAHTVELTEQTEADGVSTAIDFMNKSGWRSNAYGVAERCSVTIAVLDADSSDLNMVSGIFEPDELKVETGEFAGGKRTFGERLIVPMAAGKLTVLMAEQASEGHVGI